MGKALAFIISQFHADSAQQQEFNKDFAKALAREIYCDGYVPVVPHLYFPRFLADEGQKRQWGIISKYTGRVCGSKNISGRNFSYTAYQSRNGND